MNDPDFAVMDAAMVLESFDEPIVIHRSLLPLCGSVNAALLLTWLINVSQEQGDETEGWLSFTQADLALETGLTRYEQEVARRALRTLNFLEERRMGMPARLEMRICARAVAEAMRAQGRRRYGAFLAARKAYAPGAEQDLV